jgi:ribonuclease HII
VEQLTFGAGPAATPAAVAQVPVTPGYEIERDLGAAGTRLVAGVDEVGRGAWA